MFPSPETSPAKRVADWLVRRLLSINQKERIYIVPTWHGIVFLLGLVWAFFEGALQANQLVYLVAFCLVTLFLVGMFQTNENLKGTEIGPIESVPGPVGGHVRLTVYVVNRSRDPRFGLGLQFQVERRRYRATLGVLRKESREKLEFSIPAKGRGIHPVPRVRLFTVFPLGLFYAWKWQPFPAEYFVYPKPEGTAPLRGAIAFEGKAYHLEGDDFSGHRYYQRGDPKRAIDWKARARGLPWLIKVFDEGESGCRALRWEDLQSLTPDERLSQLSLWVHDCHKAGETYTLVLPEGTLGPDEGIAHFQACLKALAAHGVRDVA